MLLLLKLNCVFNKEYAVSFILYGRRFMQPERLSMQWTSRSSGEDCDSGIMRLGALAWREFPELQTQELPGYLLTLKASLDAADRVELLFHRPGSRETEIAVFVFAMDLDPHVGPCLTVQLQYVVPEFRQRGLARRAFRIAREVCITNALPVLAWTHRKRDFLYETRYRRI